MLRATVLACLGVLTVAGCAARRDAAPRPAPLRVAVTPDHPPYAFRRGGQLVGLEVDFARELAAALGRPLDLVQTPWTDLIPALRAHRVAVVMAGMTITRARQLQIGFSAPYLRSGLLAVVRSEDVARFRTARSVLATTDGIGVVAGTTGERFVREHARDAQLFPYVNAQAAIDELRQRRITVAVLDAPVAVWFASTDEGNLGVLVELLNEEQLGWGLAPDDDRLRTDVDAVLARWRADGTRDRILGRWLPYWRRLEAAPAVQ